MLVKKYEPTFGELAVMYLHHKRKGDDISRLRRWLDAFGDKPATSIRSFMVEEIMCAMKKEGYKPATIARSLVVLKAVYNRAVRNELIEKNPVARVAAPKFDNTLVRYLTEEQEVCLFEILPERLHPIVIVALHTGCRQGELLKLVWGDVDFNSGSFLARDPKNKTNRRVLMNSTVQEVLLFLPGQDVPAAPVFANTIGGAMARTHLSHDFKEAVEKANLAPFRFHDLRHTFASRLAMSGANDRTLQTLLGHKSQSMILRYAHLGPTHLWNAVKGLSKFSRRKLERTPRGFHRKVKTRKCLIKNGVPNRI